MFRSGSRPDARLGLGSAIADHWRTPAAIASSCERRSPRIVHPVGPTLRRSRRDAKIRMSSTPVTSTMTHPLAFLGALVLLVVLLPAGYLYWNYASHFESTDDAFVAARQFTIAPKVPGYLTAVPVTDNEHVVAGQVIARIDDRDYRNALAEAKAQVAAARANIENIDAQIVVQQAQIHANQAQLDEAQAALVFAQQQAKRYQELAATGIAGTVQDAQRYTSGLRQQQAAVGSAQATLALSQRQIEALKAQRVSAVATMGLCSGEWCFRERARELA